MAAPRNRPHIVVAAPATAEDYQPTPRGPIGQAPPSPGDRAAHGDRLRNRLNVAFDDAQTRRAAARDIEVEGTIEGIYVEFESFPDIELALPSLEPRNRRNHPELRAVKSVAVEDRVVQRATVFVPDEQVGDFLQKFEQYATENTRKGHPRHRKLAVPIADLRLATLEAFWTESTESFPPPEERRWWELWLREREGVEERIVSFAEQTGVVIGPTRLLFEDRRVLLALATAQQLSSAIGVLDDLAELRRPTVAAQPLADWAAADQREFVDDLAGRISPLAAGAPAVCLLDTGVDEGHPLITTVLMSSDAHTCHPQWGPRDRRGHGTQMAGVALYGDLGGALLSPLPATLAGQLESVKILPDQGLNDERLYAALTAQAVSLPEIAQPERDRIFVMAVSADSGEAAGAELGQPTGWSAALDALAAGQAIDVSDDGIVAILEEEHVSQRLFCVSAGNVRRPYELDHLTRSDLEPIEDPGQAWNVITVGASTELHDLSSQTDFNGWAPLAPRGELSPFSRTSVGFKQQWPHKPDVVCEGGNAAVSPARTAVDTPGALGVLTTRSTVLGGRLLTTMTGTSPATAAVGGLATELRANYPDFWPETLRALIVQSARWSPQMITSTPGRRKQDHANRVRRYGWGVPDRERTMRSADDAVTLIAQDAIRPYTGGKMREIHLHDLPWPDAVLADLGDTQVELRVALSYFVLPNPSRRGWTSRFRYASHGLRFDIRRATESREEFRQRLNQLARAEDEERTPSADDTGEWFLGPQERVRGSLHVDYWTGSAADLAQRATIAVFPVTGWWKELPARDRSDLGARYSLIVTIESPEVEVDLWTPVAVAAGTAIPIEIPSEPQ